MEDFGPGRETWLNDSNTRNSMLRFIRTSRRDKVKVMQGYYWVAVDMPAWDGQIVVVVPNSFDICSDCTE